MNASASAATQIPTSATDTDNAQITEPAKPRKSRKPHKAAAPKVAPVDPNVIRAEHAASYLPTGRMIASTIASTVPAGQTRRTIDSMSAPARRLAKLVAVELAKGGLSADDIAASLSVWALQAPVLRAAAIAGEAAFHDNAPLARALGITAFKLGKNAR